MANNNNNKILNVPNKRFPEFIGEWKKCKLGEIADFTKGAGISKDQRSSKGNPCILYGELYTTYKSEIISDIVSKTNIDSTNLVKSKYNDVIIPASGETAIDISTARCVPYNDVLLGGDLNIIRLKDGNDGSFFSYQFNGVRKRDIAKVAQGVSVVHLYNENLKAIKVNSPEIAEQNKISSLLCLIDQRISTQNKIINKLESLIKGLGEEIANSAYANTMLKRCLECHTSALQESDVNSRGNYPVYGANGIVGYTETYQAECDAILIIKDGSSVGSVSTVCGKFSVIGTLNYLTPKVNYSLHYIYFCLKSFNFYPYKTGMAIPHIYFKDYSNAKIYCPSFEIQCTLAKGLMNIESKIKIERKYLTSLIKQKTFLLQQMFI